MDQFAAQGDEEIASAVQKGDFEAFGTLVERYEGKLMRYANKFLQSKEDKKDLIQEVFLKAYSNIQSFNLKLSFSSWIYRIAHNEFVNALKKKSFRNTISVSLLDFDVLFPHLASNENPDTDISRKEIKEEMDSILGELDSKYREPLVLHYYEDMPYKDIADVLQVPVSTVGVRIQRGKAMLKKKINHE